MAMTSYGYECEIDRLCGTIEAQEEEIKRADLALDGMVLYASDLEEALAAAIARVPCWRRPKLLRENPVIAEVL